jgi:hypothetical protein
MQSSRWMSPRFVGNFIALILLACARRASAQACCAGGAAITPARLGLHEDALLGTQVRLGSAFGSFDSAAKYLGSPAETAEIDAEYDLFGALRWLGRGQTSLLLPVVQTYRRSRSGSESGGGIGDINLAARYDFFLAGQSRILPGIGLLAGLTVPSGTPPDAASKPQATDATGIGAYQLAGGIAVEQTFSHWLFGVTAWIGWRTPRSAHDVSTQLAPQWTLVASGAYVFDNDAAVAVFGSYSTEGDAHVESISVSNSSRRLTTLTLAGVVPIDDHIHFRASAFINPPAAGLGNNQPATLGTTIGATWSFL